MARAEAATCSYSVVWFKRDLRCHDHTALIEAARSGPVLCVYIVEPTLWAQPDAARQHYHFLRESLQDLATALRELGGDLRVFIGEAVEVLASIQACARFSALFSHEETGNHASYQRDLAVKAWCVSEHVAWHEWRQFGVLRGLKNRNEWQAGWELHMAQAQQTLPAPLQFFMLPLPQLALPSADQLQLPVHEPRQRQRGGRRQALQVLHEFLGERSQQYRGGISSPLSAATACSRLSPYLAFGCLSMREVVQATHLHIRQLPASAVQQRRGLENFISRLYWHCHFIQKLESEPELEWHNLHRGYDGLRENDWNEGHFQALIQARTGWPLVDACVTMLHQTGWLNFRMRAMLVSVAAYPLWLHWRPVGEWLAREFLDYEPGIHWSQLQMQSGTTGINTPRIYNPIKQAQDHDPHGHFVRRWLPAMRRVPDSWLFEPWRMPVSVQQRCGITLGEHLAEPIVDLSEATRAAKTRLLSRRAQTDVRAGKADIVNKHASRRKTAPRRTTQDRQAEASTQLSWEL
ncbi:MAG: FAD-binding domain-containing protein [Pseudomonadota bacterium]